jgi:tetratricopeptide (TPR) repeat protein
MTATDNTSPTSVGAETRTVAALRAERDFLLRSLADLEAEHAAGDLADDRYRELHDRYTVQAATVLLALERLDQETAPSPTSPRRRRRATVAAVVVAATFLGGGGALLVSAADDRQPGQTITGNAQSGTDDLEAFARAARQRPEDAGAQLAYATALMEDRQLVDALRAFDDAARLQPTNPIPKAYGGWIVFLAGLPDEALTRLDAAVAANPAYPDARFFRGMVLLRGRADETAALAEFREYLRLAPNGPEHQQVQALVDQLAAATTSTSTP